VRSTDPAVWNMCVHVHAGFSPCAIALPVKLYICKLDEHLQYRPANMSLSEILNAPSAESATSDFRKLTWWHTS